MSRGRRRFLAGLGAGAGLSLLPSAARAQVRRRQVNLLGLGGYESEALRMPFAHQRDAEVQGQRDRSSLALAAKLRAGETAVWDIVSLLAPWTAQVLWPEGLIRSLPRARFEPAFAGLLPPFPLPWPPAFSADGQDLIGLPQRIGPCSLVIDAEAIAPATAEDQGYALFDDPALAGRFGILLDEDWTAPLIAKGAGLDPALPLDADGLARFEETARRWFRGAALLSRDPLELSRALAAGEIACFLGGGIEAAAPARLQGALKVRSVTPREGGYFRVEQLSLVNNPQLSSLAEDYLAYLQEPEACRRLALAPGRPSPLAQMSRPEVLGRFSAGELEALQWDSLQEEAARSIAPVIPPDLERLNAIWIGFAGG